MRDVLILKIRGRKHARNRRKGIEWRPGELDAVDIVVDVVAEHVELAAEAVAGSEQAVLLDVDADFLGLADFWTQIGVRQEAEETARSVGADRKVALPGAGRNVSTVHERLGDRRRAISLGVADVRRHHGGGHQPDSDFRREAVAAGGARRRVQLIVVVADRTDHLQQRGIVGLPLNERAGHRALAAGGGLVGVAALVEGRNVVAETVTAVSHGMTPVAGFKAGRVVNIETESVDQIAALIADAAGNAVARLTAGAVAGGQCGVVQRLDLLAVGPIPVDLRIPVENLIVRSGVLPAQRCRVVLQVGRIHRGAVARRARLREGLPHRTARLANIVDVFLKDSAELDFMTVGRTNG